MHMRKGKAMKTIRKKIIDLLDEFPVQMEWHDNADLANFLLSHGVTVQEWISVKDRLPTIYNADDDNCVLAIHKATKRRYFHWRSVVDNPFDFTHWIPTPKPPKGE